MNHRIATICASLLGAGCATACSSSNSSVADSGTLTVNESGAADGGTFDGKLATDSGSGSSDSSASIRDSSATPPNDGSDDGDGGFCAPVAVTGTPIPYGGVVPQPNACTAQNIADFIAACASATGSNVACQGFFSTYPACIACIIPSDDAGMLLETGGFLFNSTGMGFSGNTPGCIALADPSNGPACAQGLEPLLQCEFAACFACMEREYDRCKEAARAANGPCSTEYDDAVAACALDDLDGGVAHTKCATLADQLNVICGTGP